MTEITRAHQRPTHLWRPGESGNPAGRPRGSRNKLAEDFVAALYDDFRDHGAAAIAVCRDLLAEQARVVVYDPKVPADEIRHDILGDGKNDPRLTVASSAYEAAEGAHAVAIVTEWDEFKTLDYEKIFAGMAKPAAIFDGRNILDLEKLKKIGFRAHGVGKC